MLLFRIELGPQIVVICRTLERRILLPPIRVSVHPSVTEPYLPPANTPSVTGTWNFVSSESSPLHLLLVAPPRPAEPPSAIQLAGATSA